MRNLVLVVALASLSLAHAQPPDQKALPDGGSIVQSADGGSLVTVDTGQKADWVATLRARSSCGSPSVYYLFSASGTAATSNDQLLEVDKTFDLPVLQGQVDKYSFVSFLGEDGGIPCVTVHKNALGK